MRVSTKADYAIRAAVELAAQFHGYRCAESIAQAQHIPLKFLQTILSDLRQGGIVSSHRGVDGTPVTDPADGPISRGPTRIDGGFRLARPAQDISVADVLCAADGTLAMVRGVRPQDLDYPGAAAPLRVLWVAMRASVRGVLENVTLADLAKNKLPVRVRRSAQNDDAWRNH